MVADEAAQIFGGRALTQTGMGRYCERFWRTVKFGAILGGSEEIMADLGIKQTRPGGAASAPPASGSRARATAPARTPIALCRVESISLSPGPGGWGRWQATP
jgi:hypothetical protein